MLSNITIKGARENNLKNIDIVIPRNKIVVITGLSGSGKSTLAFDTIYAEGQRRYVESLSAYARQFLGLMEKPDVDQIDGLSPAISIDQKSTSRNPRSTVATVTEIYDYLRLLYARIGVPHHPKTGHPLSKQTKQEIISKIIDTYKGQWIMIQSPVVRDRKGQHEKVFRNAIADGFLRAEVDGDFINLDTSIELDKKKKHKISIIVDRLLVGDDKQRLNESIESTLNMSDGLVITRLIDKDGNPTEHTEVFSENYASIDGDDFSLPEIEPRIFSFNSPHGACIECTGLGMKKEIDSNLVVPNMALSISEGGIKPWSRNLSVNSYYFQSAAALGDRLGFTADEPLSNLSHQQFDALLYGHKEPLEVTSSNGRSYRINYEGIIPNLERRYTETDSDYMRTEINKYMRELKCPGCDGKRLKPEILAITISGKSIADCTDFTIAEAMKFFSSMDLNKNEMVIAKQILKEIKDRLEFMNNVGLNYLNLNRAANTLAGGEAQRIRLATQIGSGLMGVLYVLDEPSIGLHQRDNDRLITTLKRLRELGNTVLIVEHDEDTIKQSDWVIDIGPGAGVHGGEVVAEGHPNDVIKAKVGLTAEYLSGKRKIETPKKRRKGNGKFIKIIGAEENNLKNIDVKIPLGVVVAVTGVSGSGKSTLVNDILAKRLSNEHSRASKHVGKHKDIQGLEHVNKVIDIDQSPIGRTPRSNPATYTGVFTDIRNLFSMTEEAKIRGYKPGRFSFNVKGGRCEACRGDGILKIEMHFLPDVYIPCDVCHGKRYNDEALDIKFNGKTIADVLDMTIEESFKFFENIPSIEKKMRTLTEVGLGYIKLGQSATTLSGGEAQRVKLSTELSKTATGKTFYILDEPTTGLHFHDVARLLEVINRLADNGNSILIIEHNLDMVKSADYIIDLGPEGGSGGGTVIAKGSPEQIIKDKDSITGKYLKKIM